MFKQTLVALVMTTALGIVNYAMAEGEADPTAGAGDAAVAPAPAPKKSAENRRKEKKQKQKQRAEKGGHENHHPGQDPAVQGNQNTATQDGHGAPKHDDKMAAHKEHMQGAAEAAKTHGDAMKGKAEEAMKKAKDAAAQMPSGH